MKKMIQEDAKICSFGIMLWKDFERAYDKVFVPDTKLPFEDRLDLIYQLDLYTEIQKISDYEMEWILSNYSTLFYSFLFTESLYIDIDDLKYYLKLLTEEPRQFLERLYVAILLEAVNLTTHGEPCSLKQLKDYLWEENCFDSMAAAGLFEKTT